MRKKIAAAATSFIISIALAHANELSTDVKSYAISPQPISTALKAFAAQSDMQLIYTEGDVGAATTQGVSGELPPRDALDKILQGTNLEYQITSNNVVVIRKLVQSKTTARHSQTHGMRLVDNAQNGQGAHSAQTGKTSDPAADESNDKLQEIVVSAQKREERLQDVPISISVLSGADLDSSTVEGITEALSRIPGVGSTVAWQSGGTLVAVRGVTAGGPIFTGSNPVGYYLDSVPFGLVKSAVAPDANAYDMERVEVLRGPQGTLYGASAQNGVVRVLTKDADVNGFDFKARTSASSTDDGGQNYRGDMAVNVPLVPGKVAVRGVVGYQDLSGWVDKPNDEDANDAEIRNLRLKLNAQPSEQLSIGLSAWISRAEYGAPPTANDLGQHSSLVDESLTTDYNAYGAKVGYDFGKFTLASMTSYLDYENAGNVDLTPSGFAATLFTGLDAEVFSQEVVLNSAADNPWRWSFGTFYRDGEDRLRQNNLGGGAPFDYSNGSESYAVFGEIGRRFYDNQLAWSLGVRYFHDDVVVKENVNQGLPGDPLENNKNSFDSTTPRAVLTWYPNEDVTVYGSYSEGFRSGFSQDPWIKRAYPDFRPAKPDKLRNYEIGAKAELLNRRLSFDTAVYFIDWQDVQQSLAVPSGDGSGVTALINGDSASGLGVDFAVTARVVDQVQLGLNFSWNDLTMDTTVISENRVLFDKGDRLNLSSEYTAGAWADYSFPIGGSGYEGRLTASTNYTSKQQWRTIWQSAQSIGSGDAIMVSKASFAVEANKWVATLFVDNLSNEDGTVTIPPFPVTADWAVRLRPRTIGMQFEFHF